MGSLKLREGGLCSITRPSPRPSTNRSSWPRSTPGNSGCTPMVFGPRETTRRCVPWFIFRLRGGRWKSIGAFGLALHNGQLLSQGEVLERELALRLQARSGGGEQDVQQVQRRGRLA
jgi:hypothetical protein